jgi:hypothetical protein
MCALCFVVIGANDESAILESILIYQALENISNYTNYLTKLYNSFNENIIEYVDDTIAYDSQLYED